MKEEDIIKKLNRKVEQMTIGKKVIVLVLLFIIFISLYYVATIDVERTITYKQHGEVLCEELYINGELQGEPCPQNEYYYPDTPWLNQQQIGLKNITLNQTQN